MQDPYRDYNAEMRAVIDAKTKGDTYVPGQVAAEIVGELQITDPELLIGWLELNAVAMVRNTIATIERSKRAYTHIAAKPTAFAAAAKAHAAGDTVKIKQFLNVRYSVDTTATRKRLADMTAADLMFVAEEYDSQAKRSVMHAEFMRRLAIKVGTGKVSDHYSDEQLTAMWSSLGR